MLTTPQVANLRRIFCVALLAVALGALALVSGEGQPVGRAHAATGNCVRHTRRVVKHVKRHGKRTRIVQLKHYWTCEEVPATAPVTTPSAPAPSTPAPTPAPVTEPPKTEPQPEPEANAIGVTADDHTHPYSYLPSRTTVRPGRLTVQLSNKGEDAHDMYMEKVGPNNEPEGEVIKVSTKTEPETQTTKSVEVETGTYRMWCSFGNHAMEGMETHITVAE